MGWREESLWRPRSGTESGWWWQGRETLKDEAGEGTGHVQEIQVAATDRFHTENGVSRLQWLRRGMRGTRRPMTRLCGPPGKR